MLWENESTKKIFKVSIILILFMICTMFVFKYGWNFYNKVRCGSRGMTEKMMEYCKGRELRLIDIKFEDGMCISICGK